MQHQYFGKPSYSPSPLYLLLQHLLCVKGPVFSAAHLFAPCVTHQWTFEQLVVVKRERGGQRGAESPWHVLGGGGWLFSLTWREENSGINLLPQHCTSKSQSNDGRASLALALPPWLDCSISSTCDIKMKFNSWKIFAWKYPVVIMIGWCISKQGLCVVPAFFFFFTLALN